MGFLEGDSPDPPNYKKLAEQQATADAESARLNVLANRPDIYTPEGSTIWEQGVGGNQDRWAARQTLTPEAQRAFDANQRVQTGVAELGEQAVGSVGDLFSTKYETPGQLPGYAGPEGELGTFGENRQATMDAMMGRVNTDIGRDRESRSAQLIAQGIPKGSEAYEREMEGLDRKQTDARQQAEIAATQMATQEYGADIAGRGQTGREGMADYTTGMDTYKQGITNALLERQTPLNEISAFRSGSQVNIPQFQPYGQQQFTGGPDYLNAGQMQYGADLGQYNADQALKNQVVGGLFDIGSAAAGAAAFSDRRLKHDIQRIGELESGIPIYIFSYNGEDKRHIGVMAQEVLPVIPEAVVTMANGYYGVKYGLLH